MIRTLAFLAGVVFWATTAVAEDSQSKINVERNLVPICPIDDCYLTLVDEMLCSILDQVFDDKKASFSNILNCIDGAENTYLCLNVLSEKRYNEERKTEYSDPNILELMTNFQVRLDSCLIEWEKGISLKQELQTVTYQLENSKAALKLSEFRIGGINYDRLTLELSHITRN